MKDVTQADNSKMLLNGSEEFLHAAEIILKSNSDGVFGLAYGPTNYLILHSLELALKALLLTRGWEIEQFKNMRNGPGHNIEKLAKCVIELGDAVVVQKMEENKNAIKYLSDLYKNKYFEYPRASIQHVINQDILLRYVDEIIQIIRPIVDTYYALEKSSPRVERR